MTDNQGTMYTGELVHIARYENPLNITVKAPEVLGRLCAPSWSMVLGHKAGKGDVRYIGEHTPLTDQMYVDRFSSLMWDRFSVNADLYRQLLTTKNITLLCFCPEGEFCHRHVLVEKIFPEMARRLSVNWVYMGEH